MAKEGRTSIPERILWAVPGRCPFAVFEELVDFHFLLCLQSGYGKSGLAKSANFPQAAMGGGGRVCGVGNLPVLKGLHPLGYFRLFNHQHEEVKDLARRSRGRSRSSLRSLAPDPSIVLSQQL
jgi:hypothetical protein